MPPQGIAAPKASEAVGVLVGLVGKEREELAMASVRAVVKCLGVLLGFCDLQDWDSINLGFETLLNLAVDRRPKVCICIYYRSSIPVFVCVYIAECVNWMKDIKQVNVNVL